MSTRLLKILCIVSVAGLAETNPVRGQNANVADVIEYVNLRLSHSTIESIDQGGMVVIKTPDESLRFNIQEMSFTYNGLNGDDRVRVLCNYCIGRYDGKYREGSSHRESFKCRSKKNAYEVIDTLNRLKRTYIDRDAKLKMFDQQLNTGDSSLPYASVSGAIDFANQNLVLSTIMNVDGKGKMLINAPDDIYEVDLKKAEFGFNDLTREPKLRIYGEWCIAVLRKDRAKEMSRESFQIASRDKALDVIKAMYFIKSAFTGMDAATVKSLRNVTGRKVSTYASIAQAVDYVNDRLAYSIILSIDEKGVATVNSMEEIYFIDVKAGNFNLSPEKSLINNIINVFFHQEGQAVLVESHDGIEGYEGGKLDSRTDKQSFQCKSDADVQDVIKAFEFIKTKLGGTKGS